MAHKIHIDQQGKASVFVVGEPAWHKLGKTLDKPLTAEEAIKEAGLDYTVETLKLVSNLDRPILARPPTPAIKVKNRAFWQDKKYLLNA